MRILKEHSLGEPFRVYRHTPDPYCVFEQFDFHERTEISPFERYGKGKVPTPGEVSKRSTEIPFAPVTSVAKLSPKPQSLNARFFLVDRLVSANSVLRLWHASSRWTCFVLLRPLKANLSHLWRKKGPNLCPAEEATRTMSDQPRPGHSRSMPSAWWSPKSSEGILDMAHRKLAALPMDAQPTVPHKLG